MAELPFRTSRSGMWALAALLALAAHLALTAAMLGGFVIAVGSVSLPTPAYLTLAAVWAPFGTAAAAALACALAGTKEDGPLARAQARLAALPDRTVVLAGILVAIAGGVLVRVLLLRGEALTDDEASYRFAARLLATGRLFVPSPVMKLHFDHPFLINDGRYESPYFLGWPALAAPGAWLGLLGFMNALYFGASVPAVFLVARRLAGSAWAKAGMVLWVTSPFLLVLAATELSETSCLAALAWAAWLLLRSRDTDAGPRVHAAFAIAFAIAFWVRPFSSLCVGAPLLVFWARDRIRFSVGRARAAAAFLVPALLMAVLFLAVQARMHGSPWRTGYRHGYDYHLANALRFSSWDRAALSGARDIDLPGAKAVLVRTSGGLLQLGLDLFGWPIGLLALVAAAGRRGSAVPWGMLAGGIAGGLLMRSPGIDTFGPVHWAALALPVTLLTILAFRSASDEGAPPVRSRLPAAGFASLIAVSWLGFVPFRWATLASVAGDIHRPAELVERAVPPPAVVFAPAPLIACGRHDARHFRFFRPGNGPDLDDPILWVNHVSLESDRALMTHFPGRRGYALRWNDRCVLQLKPLEEATAEWLPPSPYAAPR